MTDPIKRLRRLAEAAPAGKWEVWTSNSWRRVYARDGGHTAMVIEPSVQRTDNHPDLTFGPGVAEYLEAVGPESIIELLDHIAKLETQIADANAQRPLVAAAELTQSEMDELRKCLASTPSRFIVAEDDVASMITVPHSSVICKVAGVTIVGPVDHVVAARAALEANPAPTYPDELTPDLREVLSRPNFQCSPIAHVMRAAGVDIKPKAEDEQAVVLHWMIKLVLRHGEKWREVARDELDAMTEKIALLEFPESQL
jgi:hypothetical protein